MPPLSLPHPARLSSLFKNPAFLYSVGLCIVACGYLLWWPIVAGDTDLWTHLDDGRYLFEHRAIPRTLFFTFISPPRAFLDHEWLFQGIIYLLYRHWGYGGLLALRGLMYLTTMGVILALLFTTQAPHRSSFWSTCLSACYSLLLIPRSLAIRPHLFTYGLVAAFLYILECRRDRAILLPFLAVLWCNVHGGSYLLLLWIVVSYSLEYVVNRLTGHSYDRHEERRVFVPLVLSSAAVFLTPYGFRLLGMAILGPMTYESQFIEELQPLSLHELFSFQLSTLTPSLQTVFNLLFLAACVAVMLSCVQKRVRVSHLLLFLGGSVLLSKGGRFMNECVLLALPVLAANPLIAPEPLKQLLPKPAAVLLTLMLLATPPLWLARTFVNRPRYPFSSRSLPEGVATFLKRLDVGGTVFNHPNPGGYLRWRLYPNYKIFMNMEMPGGFTAEDLELIRHAFREPAILSKILSRYEPAFLTVPIGERKFPTVIRQFPDYVLVFFDDAEVLYVNARRYPAIAQHYALHDVDPFALIQKETEDVIAEREQAPLFRYLPRLLDMYPDGGIANHLAAASYNADGAYDRALPHAEAIIRAFPESPIGYTVKGDALRGLGLFDEAIACYRMALKRLPPGARRDIFKKIGMLSFDQHRYPQAYEALKQSLDLFSPETTLDDLYRLGTSALSAGKRREAKAIFRYFSDYRIAPDDTVWGEKVREALARLEEVPGD